MPEKVQQHHAAAQSARVRTTRRLVRELGATKPLTEAQRAEIIAAARNIPVVAP